MWHGSYPCSINLKIIGSSLHDKANYSYANKEKKGSKRRSQTVCKILCANASTNCNLFAFEIIGIKSKIWCKFFTKRNLNFSQSEICTGEKRTVPSQY